MIIKLKNVNDFFKDELLLAALNLTMLISDDFIFVLYSCCDSSSLSSFPKNLFNNLFEKFSAEFLRFSKTPFFNG